MPRLFIANFIEDVFPVFEGPETRIIFDTILIHHKIIYASIGIVKCNALDLLLMNALVRALRQVREAAFSSLRRGTTSPAHSGTRQSSAAIIQNDIGSPAYLATKPIAAGPSNIPA